MNKIFKDELFLISLAVSIHLLFLIYGVNALSISYGEAVIYFKENSLLHYIVRFSTYLFGQNDFALRLPFVFLHVLSTILLYKVGKKYLKRKMDRVFATVIYLLLPGTNSAALLVDSAEIVIFLTLLFILLYKEKKYFLSYFVLFISLFVDNSFSILYLSLLFYSLHKKNNVLLFYSILLFGVSMYIWGFYTGGKPKNYFIDTFAIYSAIFSPLVFLYFFYTEYRILIKEKKDMLWFVSFIAFLFSLLLSFRQKVMLEDFAPFAIISTPLMVRTFLSSYRVRIPELRFWHKLFFILVISSLILNFLAIYFNKSFYLLLSNPKKHFIYRYDFAKEIAKKLKSLHIAEINSEKKLALRLKFYGIKEGGKYKLSKNNKNAIKNVTISYYKKPIYTLYVTK